MPPAVLLAIGLAVAAVASDALELERVPDFLGWAVVAFAVAQLPGPGARRRATVPAAAASVAFLVTRGEIGDLVAGLLAAATVALLLQPWSAAAAVAGAAGVVAAMPLHDAFGTTAAWFWFAVLIAVAALSASGASIGGSLDRARRESPTSAS